MSRGRRRAGGAWRWVWLVVAGLAASAACADAGWFEQGDTVLRNDLMLLNDARVIRLPVNQWPMPRAAVRYALANARERSAVNAAVSAALARVRARLDAAAPPSAVALDAWIIGGDAGLLRDFDTLSRDNGEVGARAQLAAGERAEASLVVRGVADASDGHTWRVDGSHATVQLGNWLLSAHELDRWWGPSHESSLILSNNARPMPTLMVERAEARAFETRWLNWLGPWRMSFGVSRMENERQDIDKPLFLAWRIAIMPFHDIELGFSRTAQFCGEELECNLNVFGNLLAGNDNVGIDATPENEPGNQMAGFDLRWASPIGDGPWAIYSQAIGEDESSYVPAKYLMQFGAEMWKPFGNGGLLQAFAEYSSTTCSANTGRGPYYDCAYTQGRFTIEGYRYEGRVIGHTTDNDAETYSLGGTYTAPDGTLWSATARISDLNRDGYNDRNTVSGFPQRYNALELGWKGAVSGVPIDIDLGIESLDPLLGGDRTVQVFGFVGWRHKFRP